MKLTAHAKKGWGEVIHLLPQGELELKTLKKDRKDGRRCGLKAPLTWKERLQGIASHERLLKEKVQRDGSKLVQELEMQTQKKKDDLNSVVQEIGQLQTAGKWVNPQEARKQLKKTKFLKYLLLPLLILADIGGIFAIAREVTGQHPILCIGIAISFAATMSLLTSLTLNKIPDTKKAVVFWSLITIAGILIFLGALGIVFFRIQATSTNLETTTLAFIGNLLLSAALVLGVPLMVGLIHYESSYQEKKCSRPWILHVQQENLKEDLKNLQISAAHIQEELAATEKIFKTRTEQRHSNFVAGFAEGPRWWVLWENDNPCREECLKQMLSHLEESRKEQPPQNGISPTPGDGKGFLRGGYKSIFSSSLVVERENEGAKYV